MTYGESKQFEKDCIFKTEVGNFDCRQIRFIDSRIRFNCADSLGLKFVDLESLDRALTATINHYTDMLNTIRKSEGKSNVS